MGKRKLMKRGNKPVSKTIKSIPFETVDGNKGMLRATVVGVETKNIRKEEDIDER